MPRAFLHADVLSWLRGASRGEPAQRGKCLEHLRQLVATGETPFKYTHGYADGVNKDWRRSKLFGSRFYLWWAPCGAMRQIAERAAPARPNLLTCDPGDAFVRTITHHDETAVPVLPDAHRPELWTELTPELLGEIAAPSRRPGRSGPRAGRGRVGAAGDASRAVDARAARKQRKLARRAARRASRAAEPTLLPPPQSAPAPEQPRCACGQEAVRKLVDTEPGPCTHCARCFADASRAPEPAAAPEEGRAAARGRGEYAQVPAAVQQAILDLYSSELTQKQVARRIGIKQPTFNQWVSGRRHVAERYWPRIMAAAESLRPKTKVVRRKRATPAAPPAVQQAILDLYDSKTVARAEVARRLGVSAGTFTQWVGGAAVAEHYWPLIRIVADKVRAADREAAEFERAVALLAERHGADELPRLLGVRDKTLADYYKYGVLPARDKVRRAIELTK